MDRIRSESRQRSQAMIEQGAKDFLHKFAQIESVFSKLESEEIAAREKMRLVLSELSEEVNQAEQKHKKIQDFLKVFKEN